MALFGLAAACYATGLALLPEDSEAFGLLGLLITASLVGTSLYLEGPDEWQRARALTAFAVGGSIAMLVLGYESLRALMDSEHDTAPGSLLAIASTSWLVADLIGRTLPGPRGSADKDCSA